MNVGGMLDRLTQYTALVLPALECDKFVLTRKRPKRLFRNLVCTTIETGPGTKLIVPKITIRNGGYMAGAITTRHLHMGGNGTYNLAGTLTLGALGTTAISVSTVPPEAETTHIPQSAALLVLHVGTQELVVEVPG